MKTKRGQSIAEYAVLIGLVLGAVLAMQHYIRIRIAGGIKNQADAYMTAAGGSAVTIDRTVHSTSDQSMNMTTATTGTVGSTSSGTSTVVGLQ